MSAAADLLVLPIALPVAAAFLMPIAARVSARFARLLGFASILAALGVAMTLAQEIARSGPLFASMGGFAPPLGITLYADMLSLVLLVTLLLGGLLFWEPLKGAQLGRDILMVLLMGAGAGLALSGDLFNLFVFYEITAVASYGLAASAGSGAAAGAALRYLIVGALGSSLTLLGIALVYAATGTLNLADIARLAPERLAGPTGLTAFLFLLLGFGVKAELTPVNTWVPEVYRTAPTSVAALLAGIVSKLAIVIVLRLLVLVFPGESARDLLLVVGIAGVVAGELAAFGSITLMQAMAYSSIAQLGLVAIAFAISGEEGIAAGLALALHHALVKPALLTLANGWRGPPDQLSGAGRASPVAGASFLVLALSIIGVPPLPGFWAKYMLVSAALASAKPLLVLAVAVVLAAVVVEAAYLLRFAAILYRPPVETRRPQKPVAADVMRAGVLAAGVVATMVAMPQVLRFIEAMAFTVANRPDYIARVLPGIGKRADIALPLSNEQASRAAP